MTRSLTLTALALLIALGADSPAQAKSYGPSQQEEFMQRFDGDGDGKLTQAEVDDWRSSRVSEFNSDGAEGLSIDEYEKLWLDAYRKRMVRRFQQLDEDGDGIVTEAEFVKPMSRFVDRADRDDSGDVTLEEMRPRKRGMQRGGRGGGQGGDARRGGRGGGEHQGRRSGGRGDGEQGRRGGGRGDGEHHGRHGGRDKPAEGAERRQGREEQMSSPLLAPIGEFDPAQFGALPNAPQAPLPPPFVMPLPMPLSSE